MLGQSAFASECVKGFENYLSKNDVLIELYLNDNNLRWQVGAQIILSL